MKINIRNLYNFLDEHIVGQDRVKRVVCSWIYAHFAGCQPSPLLLAGPTASGKTEIWRLLSLKLPQIRIFDASAITAEGWKGHLKVSDIVSQVSDIEQPIIVFDEFDKLVRPQISVNEMNYSHLIQSQLLRLFDRDQIQFNTSEIEPSVFDARFASIAMTGAFAYLPGKQAEKPMGFCVEPAVPDITPEKLGTRDLINAGMMPELAGRLGQIMVMTPPSEEDMIRIVDIMRANVSRRFHTRIVLPQSECLSLVEACKASGLGARFIRTRLEALALDMIWERSRNKEELPE